ncbi:enolase C-terminal domain-like protein [Vibrio bivalvicida]|uniref:Dipeptide epimerase n=1 Tax=Vibrio bivalvicida TaxID=1276888 RepID=A0A177Y2P5_9VIBR|nr:enolase C-terminal domain-like protein [Vibrio bivalvicida]OAJ95153.1 dipeptide epimerase [Vibrio bivalvicida]
MHIEAQPHSLKLATPFIISRGTRTHCDVVRVTIRLGQWQGLGECTPYSRYHESVASVLEQIKIWQVALKNFTPIQAKQRLQLFPAGAARNALDCALWALISDMENQTFPAPYFDVKSEIETAMTVSVGNAEAMSRQAVEYAQQGATLLKVKLDDIDIEKRVAAVRQAAPHCKIVLDANEAWQNVDLEPLFYRLAQYNIAMIEQPVPAGCDELLHGIEHPIPLCADESCHTIDDLPMLKGCYEMVNIKLDKTGGLTQAFTLEDQARDLGFGIMVGCMLGTSLAMKAALPIATRAEIVDLDGPVLLGQDVKNGLRYNDGKLCLV